MKKNKLNIMPLFIVLIVALIGIITYFTSYNDHTYTITITDKERVVTGVGENSSSKYLIFGTDEGGKSKVFENTDTIMRLKFNSSDIYGELEVDSTYEITVVGFRFTIFSCYENIVRFKKVE